MPKGFGDMTPERHREVARLGGQAAHKKGVAHKWTKATASVAGKKGGQSVSKDRAHMQKIGRAGGATRGKK